MKCGKMERPMKTKTLLSAGIILSAVFASQMFGGGSGDSTGPVGGIDATAINNCNGKKYGDPCAGDSLFDYENLLPSQKVANGYKYRCMYRDLGKLYLGLQCTNVVIDDSDNNFRLDPNFISSNIVKAQLSANAIKYATERAPTLADKKSAEEKAATTSNFD